MSRRRRKQAMERAQEMRQQATLWEVALARSLHEMRCWSVLYAAARYQVYCAKLHRSLRLGQHMKQMDLAHDLLLSAQDNARHMARAIRTSESSAIALEGQIDGGWAEGEEDAYGYNGD